MVMMKTFGVIIAKALPKSRHKRSDGRAQGVIRGDQKIVVSKSVGLR
jgi:hypothetical protein